MPTAPKGDSKGEAPVAKNFAGSLKNTCDLFVRNPKSETKDDSKAKTTVAKQFAWRIPKNLEELEQVLKWTEKEGWATSRKDLELYYKINPAGFKLLIDTNGTTVGAFHMAHYDKGKTHFLGCFIVGDPSHRKQGLGTAALTEIRAQLENIGLYAIPQLAPFYNNFGFKETHKIQPWSLTRSAPTDSSEAKENKETRVRSFNSGMLESITAYDSRVFPERSSSLENLAATKGTVGCVITNEQGDVTGYAFMCDTKVGPFYADTFPDAQQLITALLQNNKISGMVVFNMPTSNKYLRLFAEYFGLTMAKDSELTAMYTDGKLPTEIEGSSNLTYSVFRPEVG